MLVKPQVKKNKPTAMLIAYHAHCIDGWTSAVIAYYGLKKEADKDYIVDLLPMQYNAESYKKLEEKVASGKYLATYVLDFSIPVSSVYAIDKYTMLVILDHHKTAFHKYIGESYKVEPDSYEQMWIQGTEILLDNSRSGAAITFGYFFPNEVLPKLVQYVQDYDLWQFKLGKAAKAMNHYLRSLDKNLLLWSNLMHRLETPKGLIEALEKGTRLKEVHDKKVTEVAAKAEPFQLISRTGLIVECDVRLISDVGHTLATKSGTFGLMYTVLPEENKIKFSLRSNPGFDVSSLASAFGGGGHTNAAGFELGLKEGESLLANGGKSLC